MQKHEWLLAVAASLAAVGVAMAAERYLGLQDLAMVFILAVLLVASRARLLTAFLTVVLCFLGYNFVFAEPRYTLYIQAQRDLATLMLFLAAALVAGRLASRLRMQVVALRSANLQADALQSLGRQLTKAADLQQIIVAGGRELEATFRVPAWLQLYGEAGPPDLADGFEERELNAVQAARQHGRASGRQTDLQPQSSWHFLPVRAGAVTIGVAGLRLYPARVSLSAEERTLLERMVDDVGQAALRVHLAQELQAVRLASETERLRSALLSSVSHDLRSPLSSMIGAADSLANYGAAMEESDRRSLLEMIRLEGERLDRYIQNLLDMTRLGQQGLALVRDWIGVDELVGSACRRLRRYVADVRIESEIPSDLPPVHLHPALIEQAIFNVLENAAKFSPPGEAIRVVVCRPVRQQLQIDISDRGPGIPENERHRIFDMFYSVERGDRGQQGTGLGLTIVQGIVGAHFGEVAALPGPDGIGTTVRLTLPWQSPDEVSET